MNHRHKHNHRPVSLSRGPGAVIAAVAMTAAMMAGACGGDDQPLDPLLPDNSYCQPVSDWSDSWVGMEGDVLVLVNQERSRGADCGAGGMFGPAAPLAIAPECTCAARVHSMDMATRGFFDHTTPEGLAPWDRMELAGYSWSAAGENIAHGQATPEDVVASWMASAGHCANIMDPAYQDVGIGYYDGAYWTMVFGSPR